MGKMTLTSEDQIYRNLPSVINFTSIELDEGFAHGYEYDIRDYGAVSGQDSRVAIQAAMDAAFTAGGGTVYIPEGTWIVSRKPGEIYCLQGKTGITMRGDGRYSILKIANGSGGGALRQIDCFNINDFHCSNFVMDGNRSGLVIPDEQTHCIDIQNAKNCSFSDMWFINTHGDGIRPQGNATNQVQNLRIIRCNFMDSSRSGIGVQSGVVGLLVMGCFFKRITDQHIDFEPTAPVAADQPFRNCIIGNIFDRSDLSPGSFGISMSGAGTGRPSVHTDVSHNVFIEASAFSINVQDVSFAFNTVYLTGSSADAAVSFARESSFVEIIGNRIQVGDRYAIGFTSTSGDVLTRSRISHNTIRKTAGAGSGIFLDSVPRVSVTHNQLFGPSVVSTGPNRAGIYLIDALGSGMPGVRLVGNDIYNFEIGIRLSGGSGLVDCSVKDNYIDTNVAAGDAAGIWIENAGTVRMNMCGNRFGSGINDNRCHLNISNAYPVTIGGLGRGEAVILRGTADPTAGGGVPAIIGSMYMRDNGAIYRKNSATDTDWVAM